MMMNLQNWDLSGLRRPVKLMTDKNDRIKKQKNSSRWNSSGSCSTVEAIAGTEYVQLDSKGTFSDSLDDAVDEPNAINTRTAFVTVANIPPSIELSKLMEALFRFGKKSNSSMRTLQDGSICCDVKFEREEATQKALYLPILRGHGTVTVRIMNACSKTSDSVVHAICQSCGFLIKVKRIDENTLDVFFGVENNSDAKNILRRLNCTIMDDCNWSASLQSGDDDASASSRLAEQISELKRLYTMKKLHVGDLENLQEVIMHIKSQNADLKEQI